MSQAAPTLRTRPGRGTPVTVIGLLGVLAGAMGVYLGIERLRSGHYPGDVLPSSGPVVGMNWSSTMGWVVAIVFVALGLMLLLAALIPGRSNSMAIPRESSTGSREVVMPNPDLEEYAASIASGLDGVSAAKAKLGGRSLDVTVKSPLADGSLIRNTIAEAVQQRVDEIGLSPAPTVRVRVK